LDPHCNVQERDPALQEGLNEKSMARGLVVQQKIGKEL
jgi:hypothetical protein